MKQCQARIKILAVLWEIEKLRKIALIFQECTGGILVVYSQWNFTIGLLISQKTPEVGFFNYGRPME